MRKTSHVKNEDPILERITDLLIIQKKDQQDLMEYLNKEKSGYTSWKLGRSKSYTKYLPQIAEFFGVSQRFLVDGVSNEEDELIMTYRELNTERKKRLLNYVRRIKKENEKQM